MKKLAINLLLTLFTSVVVFFMFELFIRIFLEPQFGIEIKHDTLMSSNKEVEVLEQSDGGVDSIFSWGKGYGIRLKANINATLRNHRLNPEVINFKTNSIGLRSFELEKKQSNEYRVLVFGDSITIGDYLNYEDLYTTRLQDLLNDKGKKIN